jgi:hypothetical protein
VTRGAREALTFPWRPSRSFALTATMAARFDRARLACPQEASMKPVVLAAVALSHRRGSPLSVRRLFAALSARRRRTRAASVSAAAALSHRRGSPLSVRRLFAALSARRRCTLAASVWLLCLCAATATAQEQRGSIEGAIRDHSNAVMPGVTVEARSPALVGVQQAVTDERGAYRFPALRPGRYEISATLQGFAPAKASDVLLELGQVLRVDLILGVGGLSERVEVRGGAPLIDVKQNAAGANVDREIIERIPKGRDFTSVVTSAPGITSEARNGGIQIDGASGADNRFLIDGVDTTNLLNGTSGKGIAPEFVQEVQVKASGYNAEYRAALGGVVSAITKSGANQFHGDAGVYFTNDSLRGDQRATLRLSPTDQNIAEYVTSPVDPFTTAEPIVDLGGPIRRDRIWFFVGYNRPVTKTTRTVTFRDNGQRGTFENKPVDRVFNWNVSSQLTRGLRGKFAASNERLTGGLTLPGIEADGTSRSNSALFPARTRVDQFNDSYSAVFDWVADSKTYVNVTSTYFTYGSHEEGQFSDRLQHAFQASNFQFADIPDALKNVSGYTDAPSSSRLVRDNLNRFNINADVTRYGTWGGQHTLKGGVQIERMRNDVQRGNQAPIVQLFWDRTYVANDGRRVRGPYGYFNVTRNVITEGAIEASNVGLFVQDAWTVNKRLTLNLGLRAEREEVPSYQPQNPGVEFGFGDKIAPRVGFAWDVRGDARWKAYGSFGVFYDLMKLTIGRVMFGGERWMNYRFTLDTFDWPSLQCGYPPESGPNCAGTFIESFDFRPVANDTRHFLTDPNLEAARSEELTFGVEHELSPTISIGARYVHKWVDYAIEAICVPVPAGEDCGVNNPGFGEGEFPLGRDLPRQPAAERLHDGFEVRLRKRFANRWSMDASYLWSHLRGNWSGLASSDEAVGSATGGLQLNSGRAFNLLYYSYDAQGRPSNGLLATDRPHQVKLQATYDTPWHTLIGANYLIETGSPLSTVADEKGMSFFPYGRGDLGRTPAYSQVDVRLQQEVRLPGRTRVTVALDAINLFDQEVETGYYTRPYRDGFNLDDRAFFAGFDPEAVVAATPGFARDARYRLGERFQSPRVIRLQARFTF